jgi:hypothetical protein
MLPKVPALRDAVTANSHSTVATSVLHMHLGPTITTVNPSVNPTTSSHTTTGRTTARERITVPISTSSGGGGGDGALEVEEDTEWGAVAQAVLAALTQGNEGRVAPGGAHQPASAHTATPQTSSKPASRGARCAFSPWILLC